MTDNSILDQGSEDHCEAIFCDATCSNVTFVPFLVESMVWLLLWMHTQIMMRSVASSSSLSSVHCEPPPVMSILSTTTYILHWDFFFSWQWLPLLKDELSCRPPIFFGRQVFLAGRDKDLSCVSSTHMFVHME